jgi:hypothetical protein
LAFRLIEPANRIRECRNDIPEKPLFLPEQAKASPDRNASSSCCGAVPVNAGEGKAIPGAMVVLKGMTPL